MIHWQQHDGVVEVGLAAPPCNEIGSAMLDGLERLVAELADSDARALVLHSELPKGFCAGADLRELHGAIAGRSPESWLPELGAFIDRIHAVMDALDTLPQTTVGALHGVCFGGGFELALTCDILVAERSTRFCFPELRLGIIPGFGGIPRLRREVASGVVRDLLLTGRSLGAKRAHELGLVSQVVARGQALSVARRVAAQAALFPASAAGTAKAFAKPIPREELEQEKAHFLRLFSEPAAMEALGRFVERTDAMPYLPEAAHGAG